nr:extracellular solute-binding protein [Clostridia bacterium]
MNKKILTALLALLTAASAVLTSCGGEKTDAVTEAGDTQPSDTTAAVETVPEETKPKLELPDDIDLDGYTVNFAVQESAGWVQQRDFKFSDEASGEPVNDAAKERIQKVEEQLNCKIAAHELGNDAGVASKAQAEILAGGSAYDVIMPGMTSIASLGNQGLLLDLNSVEHIDTSKPWWSQQVTKHLSIGGKLYFTLGDLSIIDNDGIATIGFNKQLVENYDLESPYDYVFDGTWTSDKMFSMAKKVTKDLNGDGVMDKNDLYGFVSNNNNLIYNLFGGGVTLTDKDKDDMPYASINNERTIAIIDQFVDFLNSGSYYTAANIFGDVVGGNNAFMNGQMLFRMISMFRFTQMRDMETDFGFVTIPKYDESQDSYYHGYSYASPGTAIPVTVKDTSAVGAAVEAMSYYGREIMLPAYYDITLQGKIARDDESAGVLDLIFDTAMLDLGTLYNFGGMRDIFTAMVETKTNTFTSTYASIEQNVNTAIDKLVETVSALD